MNLDDHQSFNDLDPQNMLGHIEALPGQLLKAWELGKQLPLPQFKEVKQVLIAGMGGSAIGGDLLANYVKSTCPIPVISHRDYSLPHWARGSETFVICSSHSGNTEETLSAFDEAVNNGCQVLTLSTGGKLAKKAKAAGITAWIFEHDGQPRTAIGYSFGMLLALLTRLGYFADVESAVASAVAAMKAQQESLSPQVGVTSNPAKRLAGQFLGRYVSVFAAGVLEPVARRWKTQINEIAKAWAQFEVLPEADHNTLAGLLNPEELLTKVAAVFLKAELDHPRNKLRLNFTQQAFMLEGFYTDEVTASGDTPLAQLWTLLHLGDYISYYLAMMYQVDPTPVEALAELKEKLKDI